MTGTDTRVSRVGDSTGYSGTTATPYGDDVEEIIAFIRSFAPSVLNCRNFNIVLRRLHPTPKELKAMYPYKQIRYISIVSRGTFNRKLLFPFSGYLPKRVRARTKNRQDMGL